MANSRKTIVTRIRAFIIRFLVFFSLFSTINREKVKKREKEEKEIRNFRSTHIRVYDKVGANGENEKLRKEETDRCLSLPYYGTWQVFRSGTRMRIMRGLLP